MILIKLKEWALLILLLTAIELKLFEALIQKFQKDEDAVCIYQQLTEVNKLVNTIRLKML